MNSIEDKLSDFALKIGLKVREGIHSSNYKQLSGKSFSALKGYGTQNADVFGEYFVLKEMKDFSEEIGFPIGVIIDPDKEEIFGIGAVEEGKPIIWSYIDPVDGTIKVSGLGNEEGIFRVGNDGVWGSGIAFTKPTTKPISQLTVGDFEISALVDGNPIVKPHYPTNAYVSPTNNYETFEFNEKRRPFADASERIPLKTTTQTNVQQAAILFDGFMAYDRKSAPIEKEKLAVEVYRLLANRNEGGAFDVWRMYGTFGEFLRSIFAYGKKIFEPQAVAAVRLNDHLTNVVPPYAVIKGAGGFVVDFEGKDIGDHLIKGGGRPDCIYAANEQVKKYVVKRMQKAMSICKQS